MEGKKSVHSTDWAPVNVSAHGSLFPSLENEVFWRQIPCFVLTYIVRFFQSLLSFCYGLLWTDLHKIHFLFHLPKMFLMGFPPSEKLLLVLAWCPAAGFSEQLTLVNSTETRVVFEHTTWFVLLIFFWPKASQSG